MTLLVPVYGQESTVPSQSTQQRKMTGVGVKQNIDSVLIQNFRDRIAVSRAKLADDYFHWHNPALPKTRSAFCS